MNIGIVGLGLIGGSIAKALSAKSDHKIFVWNRTEATAERAITEGAAHGILTDDRIPSCGAIFVALYPDQTVRWISTHADRIAGGSVVLDTCGVKGPVCAPSFEIAREHGFDFIGAHPMAGVEHSGYDYASETMFEGASMILVPPVPSPDPNMEAARDLAREMGFGRTIVTTAEEHDRMIAYTSQMAHVVSSAYVQSPCAMQHSGFSAGSYRDMTRVACLNEDMWTELFMDNSEPLVAEIDGLIERLEEYRDAISKRDADTVRAMLRAGREMKERADGKSLR